MRKQVSVTRTRRTLATTVSNCLATCRLHLLNCALGDNVDHFTLLRIQKQATLVVALSQNLLEPRLEVCNNNIFLLTFLLLILFLFLVPFLLLLVFVLLLVSVVM